MLPSFLRRPQWLLLGICAALLLLALPASIARNRQSWGLRQQLRPVSACTIGTPLAFPTGGATRDQRLAAWWKAQQLIAQQQWAASLPLLRQAEATTQFDMLGHQSYWQNTPGCTLFVWLLAQELGNGQPADAQTAWALSLIAEGRAAAVAQGYQEALRYQPNRSDWRLVLARALLAQNHRLEAEAVLQPVIQSQDAAAQAARLLLDETFTQP